MSRPAPSWQRHSESCRSSSGFSRLPPLLPPTLLLPLAALPPLLLPLLMSAVRSLLAAGERPVMRAAGLAQPLPSCPASMIRQLARQHKNAWH